MNNMNLNIKLSITRNRSENVLKSTRCVNKKKLHKYVGTYEFSKMYANRSYTINNNDSNNQNSLLPKYLNDSI